MIKINVLEFEVIIQLSRRFNFVAHLDSMPWRSMKQYCNSFKMFTANNGIWKDKTVKRKDYIFKKQAKKYWESIRKDATS